MCDVMSEIFEFFELALDQSRQLKLCSRSRPHFSIMFIVPFLPSKQNTQKAKRKERERK